MPKILIVDDDALTAKLYRDFLERSQFQVEIAPDGAAAMQRLESGGVDAVLVDIMMPKVNGIEFMKRVRATDQFKALPMLAYTTAFVPQFIAQAKEAGANEVFDKAKLNGQLLKAALQRYFGA